MTKQVKYTDHFVADSSVVDEVYYDVKNCELYVILHNGSQVGYRAVSQDAFNRFKAADSAGTYWNRNIKGYYVGISGDVELVAPEVKVAESEFTVIVEVHGTLTITGTAKDGNDALSKVNTMLYENFNGTSKVKSLTQNFV